MHMTSEKSIRTAMAIALSRLELEALIAMAAALEKAASNNVRLSDEITLADAVFRFAWISKEDNTVLDADLASEVDRKIAENMTVCSTRRLEARRTSRAIQELPTDAKYLALNRAIYEAEERNLKVSRGAVRGSEAVTLKPQDPRAVMIVKPKAEPVVVEGDFLVSGSNVVGGPTQLLLLEDTLVHATFFLHEAKYSQIRVQVPLGLVMVKNLVTRIRGTFVHAHPDDTYLTATTQPEIYLPEHGVPADERPRAA